MTIVADNYRFVVGVDTHAATHHYVIIETRTGELIDDAEFPTDTKGLAQLADARAGQTSTTLQILLTARTSMTSERTRAINALNALLRTHALGVDARRKVNRPTIRTIAVWRPRKNDGVLAPIEGASFHRERAAGAEVPARRSQPGGREQS
ncbi:hypothetical protein [Nocardioides sp. Root151]|uniref:hypothetical protein n=1 Tax=Nocardioides sp. Root151 TaxID=1736475 RepID=UPI000703435B|nr:hypothetical protein [Nocardioides sp. Root151]KQZ70792.1 hypothetical protein ASD66_14600 [Nocardioides sp. Root151]